MMSDNLSTLFPDTFMSFSGEQLDSHQIFAFIATIVVLPTVWLRDLSLLSYLSGYIASLFLLLSTFISVQFFPNRKKHFQATPADT